MSNAVEKLPSPPKVTDVTSNYKNLLTPLALNVRIAISPTFPLLMGYGMPYAALLEHHSSIDRCYGRSLLVSVSLIAAICLSPASLVHLVRCLCNFARSDSAWATVPRVSVFSRSYSISLGSFSFWLRSTCVWGSNMRCGRRRQRASSIGRNDGCRKSISVRSSR